MGKDFHSLFDSFFFSRCDCEFLFVFFQTNSKSIEYKIEYKFEVSKKYLVSNSKNQIVTGNPMIRFRRDRGRLFWGFFVPREGHLNMDIS